MTPRGIRNNNPGNLDNTNPWQGLIANPAESRFATFKDPTWGVRALAVTLITYHDKRKAKDGSRIDTIREVIERWAPPSENDTEAYVQAVAKAVGVSPDMEIDLHQYEIMRPTVEAIIRHENGKGPLRTDNTWYNIDVIDEGLRRAGVVKPVKTTASIPVTKETAGATVTAGIGLAVGAGMYTIGIAATVLTLVGLELLSYLFKSIGMKSSMVSFSTPNKDTLKQIADRFNSKDYLIVSYEMETLHKGEAEFYQVSMVIKSKRNNDEGHLLSLIQEFPEVTVQRIE